MITCSKYGLLGRLGNQMFQYAAIKSAALRCGDSCALPSKNNSLIKYFNFKCDIVEHSNAQKTICYQYNETSFSYEPKFLNIRPNTSLLGYFQSDRYFKPYEDKIKSEFVFHTEVKNKVQTFIDQVKNNYTLISLHVRRGDYLSKPNMHPECGLEYYQNALNYFKNENTKIVVMSDDIEWCKQTFQGDAFVYSPFSDPGEDMCLISLCDHNIIANSTFSWWGAWLNNNPQKIIIAPKKWFGPKMAHANLNDLFPEGWITI